MKSWLLPINRLGACEEALAWGEQFDTLDEAWQRCERGDWMLWLLGAVAGEPMSDGRKKLVLAACECARLALPYVDKGETRPLAAIELAEKWAQGDNTITIKQIRNAANAANANAYVSRDANAANANAYVSRDASAANAAASAAAYAAAAYAAEAARFTTLKKCADIVRKHYPQVVARWK